MSKKLVQGSSYEEAEEDLDIPSMEDFMKMQNPSAMPFPKKEEKLLQEISGEPKEEDDQEKPSQLENDTKDKASKRKSFKIPITKLKEPGIRKLLLLGGGLTAVLLITIVIWLVPKSKETEKEELPAWMDENYTVSTFCYTAEEIADLRLNGYTGKEIEDYELMEVSAASLIEKAKANRQALYDSEVAPYLDSASKEFLELYENTWVGQPELNFDPDPMRYSYYSKTINVDYEKLPTRGHQLYLKLKLESGENLFMSVTPEQYLSYRDSGNIVVTIYYTKTGNGTVVVTKIEEVTLTQ